MRNLNKTILTLALASISGTVMADGTAPTAPAAPAAPSLGAVIAATPGLTLTGYVAATYNYFGSDTPALRQFDTTQNGFTANQGALTIAYLPATGAGAQVTAIAGSDAQILRQGETGSSTAPTTQFDLYNAFAQYAVSTYTMIAGKFSTLAGAEVATPNGDNEISRSLLFTLMEPITHTGVRVVDAVSSALTLTAGVNNGWNYTSTPSTPYAVNGSSGKTLELGISGTPSKMFSYSLAYYNGDSPLYEGISGAGGAGSGTLQLFDAVGTLNATDALNFVANVDYLTKDNANLLNGTNGTGTATGIALYANYTISSDWLLSLRGEYVDDADGLLSMNSNIGFVGAFPTGTTSNTLKEGTLAINYTGFKNLRLTGELREDESSIGLFTSNGKPASQQASLEFQAIYSF